MVDAARQMLDELMGRNRNLHPTEAVRKVDWEDPDLCQYHTVKFCPHDLFINTRADLGPCQRIHDDEAKKMYAEAKSTPRKRAFEDEFLRFCNHMLNDVDRKIQKGKQRLELMQRDHPAPQLSKYQEQLNNLSGRINKLLSEAEEAGIRGDVDQAKDLMLLCEQLKDEKDALVLQHGEATVASNISAAGAPRTPPQPEATLASESAPSSPQGNGDAANFAGGERKAAWMNESSGLSEKQMEVCETCGAFLIVGDAQQRIEDHLMGKQHMGYSKLRKAVEEIYERRQKDRDGEERKRHDDREQRSSSSYDNERRRDYRGQSRDYGSRYGSDRHRHNHHRSHDGGRSHSRSSGSHSHSHRRYSRERSRSRSRY